MNWLSILLAGLAGLGFYLSSRHQALWPGAARRVAPLRAAAVAVLLAALALAGSGYGLWRGLFVVFSGLMLALVALPYLDAWRRGARRTGDRHVG